MNKDEAIAALENTFDKDVKLLADAIEAARMKHGIPYPELVEKSAIAAHLIVHTARNKRLKSI